MRAAPLRYTRGGSETSLLLERCSRRFDFEEPNEKPAKWGLTGRRSVAFSLAGVRFASHTQANSRGGLDGTGGHVGCLQLVKVAATSEMSER